MRTITRTFVLSVALAACAQAAAQEIVIGHVAGYTGPVSKDAVELGAGAQVFVDALNDKGGFNGRKVRIVVADDGSKAENTLKLIAEMKGKAVALLPMVGSANAAALVKENLLETPLVGTVPSPEIVRTWRNPNLFHIRASDRQQTERILEALVTLGVKDIAVFVPNNPFGEQATKQVETYLQSRGLKLAASAVYTLVGPTADLEPALQALQGKTYQALMMFGPPIGVADGIKALKARGETAQIYALSYADSKLIVQTAGPELARGVVISQVMPNLNTRAIPFVRAFRDDYAKYAKTKDEPTNFNIEGYLAAKLIVEAMRRTKSATPEGVRRGLEQMASYDLGGYAIDYSAASHQGSGFVDLSVIAVNGHLQY